MRPREDPFDVRLRHWSVTTQKTGKPKKHKINNLALGERNT